MNVNVIRNFSWMMVEKFVSVFGLIFVTSYVAKYIGPSAFGSIAFATSVFVIVQSIALFGSETILFKRISQNKRSGLVLMLSIKKLRTYVFIIMSFSFLIYLYFTFDKLTFIFCLATCVSTYFVTQDVIAIYNDATLNSKLNALANVFGLGFSLLLRFFIAHFGLDVTFLAIPIITTTAIPFAIRLYIFNLRNKKNNVTANNNKRYIKYMVCAGLPLAISGISISIYTRLSQILLAKYGTTAELGLFSAANTLTASWTFITTAFITSSFAIIYKQNDRERAIEETARLNGVVFIFSLITVLFIMSFGKFAISLLYGEAYLDAYPIMIILAIATAFSAMGPVAYRYIVKESGYKFLSYKVIFVLIVNLPLSVFLTSKYNIIGAAYCMLITEFLSLTVFNYFFNHGVIARIHLKTFNPLLYIRWWNRN